MAHNSDMMAKRNNDRSGVRNGHRLGLVMLIMPAIAALVQGCSPQLDNPSVDVTRPEAKSLLRAMRGDPVALERPVIVIGGFRDPHVSAPHVAKTLGGVVTDPDRILPVTFFWQNSFDRTRRRLIEKIDRAFPSDDPAWTVEVDVIGISMGGLLARYAAAPPLEEDAAADPARRLRIRHLYTIATPHRGARMAVLPTFSSMQIDMRADSSFLRHLDAHLRERAPALTEADYEILAYTRLGDMIVGESNTAPPGAGVWWLSTPPLAFAHFGAAHDPRILADVALRLRRETALTLDPPAPLPGTSPQPSAEGN